MEIHHLARMANEIGRFFEQMPDRAEATNAIAAHIRNFWEPRMRRQIIEYAREGGPELSHLAREAILTLELPREPVHRA